MNIKIPRINGATVWNADSLAPRDYVYMLEPGHLMAIDTIRAVLITEGVDLSTAERHHFETPEFTELADIVRTRLHHGPGFVVLRGWPVQELSEADAGIVYWGLASVLGTPQPQNLRGDRLHTVAETPVTSVGTTAPGGSTSNNEIILHTENARPPTPPLILGLLCLRPAHVGGDSILMSGHTVHNYLVDHYPDLLPRLYKPFRFGRHDEVYPDGRSTDSSPVFRRDGDKVAVRYGRYWMRIAENKLGVPLDEVGRQALDRVDEILQHAELTVTARLAAGDVLFMDNRVVLHGRQKFSDAGSAPEARRRLLRVWIA